MRPPCHTARSRSSRRTSDRSTTSSSFFPCRATKSSEPARYTTTAPSTRPQASVKRPTPAVPAPATGSRRRLELDDSHPRSRPIRARLQSPRPLRRRHVHATDRPVAPTREPTTPAAWVTRCHGTRRGEAEMVAAACADRRRGSDRQRGVRPRGVRGRFLPPFRQDPPDAHAHPTATVRVLHRATN